MWNLFFKQKKKVVNDDEKIKELCSIEYANNIKGDINKLTDEWLKRDEILHNEYQNKKHLINLKIKELYKEYDEYKYKIKENYKKYINDVDNIKALNKY